MVAKDAALDYTGPENRGVCSFCGGEEGGYAKRDNKGYWQAACWKCVRPEKAGATQSKRQFVGIVFTDEDADEPEAKKKKNPGLAPSAHRPKVN